MTDSLCRVTLPPKSRRPFQVLRGLSQYPTPLTFDASRSTALPPLKRRAQVLSSEIVREFLRGGPVAEMFLKGVVDGPLDLERVPAELWGEMNARAEFSSSSRGKTLRLTPEEVANLAALGFEVVPVPTETASEETAS